MCFKSNCTGSKIQVIFFFFMPVLSQVNIIVWIWIPFFLPRGDNSKRQTLKVQQQAVSGVFEGREIKTEVFVEQRRVVFPCLPGGCCLHFLLKNLQRREGERGREKPNDKLRRKRVQKNVTGIRSVGGVLYVCVHLCSVCEAFLLIGTSGWEALDWQRSMLRRFAHPWNFPEHVFG